VWLNSFLIEHCGIDTNHPKPIAQKLVDGQPTAKPADKPSVKDRPSPPRRRLAPGSRWQARTLGKNMKRFANIICLTCLIGWLATLGVFYERHVVSSSLINGESRSDRFGRGDSRMDLQTWVAEIHHRLHGIPFIVSFSTDRPPYTLSFCFTARDLDPVKAINVEHIQITYADGTGDRVTIPDDRTRNEFRPDTDTWKPEGERTLLHAAFQCPEAIAKRQSFRVLVLGFLESETGTEPYSEVVEVRIEDKSYLYIGWFALYMKFLYD